MKKCGDCKNFIKSDKQWGACVAPVPSWVNRYCDTLCTKVWEDEEYDECLAYEERDR